MKRRTAGLLMVVALSIMGVACGGGGSSSNNGNDGGSVTLPTSAVIKVSVKGSSSSNFIGAIQATLHLPAGVSVKASQNAPQTDASVVAASGVASGADLVMGMYSAASGTVSVFVMKTTGFPSGEFATVNCDIASGKLPSASGFSISDFDARDLNGSIISGLTLTWTASIK